MIETLSAFFIITGMWVWFWAAVCFALVLAFSENEKNFFAFLTVGIFVALMHHSGVISIFADPLSLLGWGIAYFIIGGIWSFIKWFSFVNKKAEQFGESKIKYIEGLNKKLELDEQLTVDVKTKVPDELIGDFNKFLADDYYGYRRYDERTLDGIIPSATENKERIVTWILWWPTSAFWTLLNDPLVRLANWMYSKFQGMYKKIANRAFAKFGVQ